jgi:hypothetical protein
MSCGSIYKIQFPNGKHYIGLTTTSLEQRTKQHKKSAKSGDTKCVYRALRKYDMVDTFELIEIDTADTIEELCEKECDYILEYNSYYMNGNGYNMTFGGEGTNGYIFTEEDKQKISERMKKYYDNPEAIQKNSEAQKKYHQENPEAGKENGERVKKYWEENPEARERQSQITTKFNEEHPEIVKERGKRIQEFWENNPDARKQRSENTKKHYEENPELGKQHSEKMKQLFENPEAVEKCSKAQKKRFENLEEREKLREKSKKHWENPETRQQQSERKKKYYEENPEARQRNSEARKIYYANNLVEWMKKRNDTQGKNKPFDVFTKDGTFIKTFAYQFEAKEYLQKEHGITSTINICAVLSGKRNSCAGFVFKYK